MTQIHEVQPQGLIKCICLGGLAGGVLSLMPLINLLNIFLLFWLWIGAALSVYFLLKQNQSIRLGDALLTGACSGLIGSLIFSIPTAFSVLSISPEQLIRMLEKLRIFYPSASNEMNFILQNHQFKFMFLLILAFTIIFSVFAGMISGMIARKLFNNKLLKN